MALLLLKLTLTPILIGGASVAARRWGPVVGGWLVALPLTSGPVALYLALDKGTAFASSAADGSLGGLSGDALFAFAYATLAVRAGWPISLVAGSAAFAVAAVAVQPLLGGPIEILFAAVLTAMAVAYAITPSPPVRRRSTMPPRWDIAARALVGTAIVLAVTEAATLLGPQLSGVVATFPVYVSVLTVFAHRLESTGQAIGILRGLQLGLFGTAAFMAALSVVLVPLGVGPGFLVALVVLLLVHGAILGLRRFVSHRAATPEETLPV